MYQNASIPPFSVMENGAPFHPPFSHRLKRRASTLLGFVTYRSLPRRKLATERANSAR